MNDDLKDAEPHAPKTLTVVMADSFSTRMRIIHENEWSPYVRRTVQIELTEEQRQKLIPKHVGVDRGKNIYEEILECWFEPIDEKDKIKKIKGKRQKQIENSEKKK